MKGGGAKTDTATPTQQPPATSPAAPAADQSKTTQTSTDTKQAGAKTPVTQMGKSMPGAIPPANTSTPPIASEAPAAVVARWTSALVKEGASKADAKDALDAIGPMLPKLSGQARSNASYAEYLAYNVLEDQDRMCRAARDVIANDSTYNLGEEKWGSHVKAARQFMSYCK